MGLWISSAVTAAFAMASTAVVLAALSWTFIEEPIRHGAIERAWARARAARWRIRPVALANAGALTATAGTAGVLVIALAGLTGAVRVPSGGQSLLASGPVRMPVTKTVVRAPKATATASPSPASGTPEGVPLRTSCNSVAHIGDSTSDGLDSPDYLPNPRQRITARYEDVGVRTVIMNVEGARSIVEVLPGGVNGYNAARSILRGGFRGCWVIALGTDDTADVAAGSTYSLRYRIDRMMRVTRGMPVMWVNVISLLHSGPYAASSMLKWNRALLGACARYPNMRIFNWAAMARRSWFISDGIHYTSLGYMHRARAIANALARAFPQVGHSKGCVVG